MMRRMIRTTRMRWMMKRRRRMTDCKRTTLRMTTMRMERNQKIFVLSCAF